MCVTLGGQPRPTPRAAPTQVLPRHSRRLPWSGAPPFPDSVESECGLFVDYVDYVDLLASPGCLAGPTSPIPSPDQSASPSPGRHSAKLRRAGQRQPGASWLVRGQRRTDGHISSPRTTAQCALRPRRAATCRPGAAFGQAAASCPAPARRQLARPRPASHSWAHQFPPHPTTVRAAPAASTDLPSPGAHGRERNRSTARCGHQNGNRGPWLCFLYP